MTHNIGGKAIRPLRVGIISAQWGVWAHLPAWRSIDGIEVAAICTSRQETADKAAQDNGIGKAYGRYADMAADPELDIIDVGTRPPLRYEMVMASLHAGKHVYAGIPFGASLAQATDMLALQRSRGLLGMTDAYIQWLPQVSRMKELIDEGYLGEPWSFSGSFNLQLFAPGAVNVPTYAWFNERRMGTSVLRNLGTHLLSTLTHLLGPVASVVADLRVVLRQWHMPDGTVLDVQTHDHAALLVRLKNGATGTLDLNWAVSDGQGFRLAVHGSKGRLEVAAPFFPGPADTVLRGSQTRGFEDARPVPLDIPPRLLRCDGVAIHAASEVLAPVFPMARAMQSLATAVRTNSRLVTPSFAQATHVQAVLQAAEQSAETGLWCEIPPND